MRAFHQRIEAEKEGNIRRKDESLAKECLLDRSLEGLGRKEAIELAKRNVKVRAMEEGSSEGLTWKVKAK